MQYTHQRSFGAMRYSEEHEWILDTESGDYLVGITDYAQDSLGEIVFIDLPSVGDEFEKGDTFGQIESVKAASELYMPVNGSVTEVNAKLDDEPGLINSSPEKDGWMIKIKTADASEVDALMDSAKYETFKEECD